MRALPVRRIATTTLCATLLLGTAGPAFASQGDASPDRTRAQQLDDLGGVIAPVLNLLHAVLTAKDNKLSPEDAKKHADAIQKAFAAAQPPAQPPAKAPLAFDRGPVDPKGDAAAALQKAIDALTKAAEAGDVKAVLTQTPTVITSAVNLGLTPLQGGGTSAAGL
ncbi:hypothetical protein ACFVYR_28890 [Streptomyces sp. NPDC058284]|uniref:hypothetical protein n=1 Tax=unclassified Streptomyces TaxID=2593676 RepID=UPI00366865EF